MVKNRGSHILREEDYHFLALLFLLPNCYSSTYSSLIITYIPAYPHTAERLSSLDILDTYHMSFLYIPNSVFNISLRILVIVEFVLEKSSYVAVSNSGRRKTAVTSSAFKSKTRQPVTDANGVGPESRSRIADMWLPKG